MQGRLSARDASPPSSPAGRGRRSSSRLYVCHWSRAAPNRARFREQGGSRVAASSLMRQQVWVCSGQARIERTSVAISFANRSCSVPFVVALMCVYAGVADTRAVERACSRQRFRMSPTVAGGSSRYDLPALVKMLRSSSEISGRALQVWTATSDQRSQRR